MCVVTLSMLVPKTPVYKNDLFAPREHQIGTTWKYTDVQPVSITKSVQNPSDPHFGPCVSTSDLLHVLASDFLRNSIYHGDTLSELSLSEPVAPV